MCILLIAMFLMTTYMTSAYWVQLGIKQRITAGHFTCLPAMLG